MDDKNLYDSLNYDGLISNPQYLLYRLLKMFYILSNMVVFKFLKNMFSFTFTLKNLVFC